MQKPCYFSNKGQLIAGTLHMPEGPGRYPCAIILHGFTGEKCEPHFVFVRLSRMLAERGIASLRFDFRGSGESAGEFEDMTPLEEVSDVAAALKVVRSMKRIDPGRLGVVGLSCGGMVAALAAGRQRAFRSVVLWAAVALPRKVYPAIHGKRAMKKLVKEGRLDIGGLYWGKRFWETARKLDPPAAVAKAGAPVLVIHGTADDNVPYENSGHFLRAARRAGLRAERLTLQGADHSFSSVPWRDAVVDATVRWLQETL